MADSPSSASRPGGAAVADATLSMPRQVWGRSSRLRLLLVAGCVAALVLVLSVRSCAKDGVDMPAFEARSGGAVWALGSDCHGQLGDGPAHEAGPEACLLRDGVLVEVEGIDDAVVVQAMDSSVFAVLGDGTVWAWGANDDGQLGDGTMTDRDAPVQLPGLSEVVDLTAQGGSVYAVRADGTVWTWSGRSLHRESVPHRIDGASGVVQVVPSRSDAFWALRADGTVMAYGCSEPKAVVGLTDVVQIGPDRSAGAVAVKQDGTAWTWHDDCDDPAPARQVPGLAGIIQVGSGTALNRDGTLWTWSDDHSPTQVSGLSNVVTVDWVNNRDAVGSTPIGTYAVRSDGSVWVLSGSSLPLPATTRLIPALPAATHATASSDAFFVIEGDDRPDRGSAPAGPAHTPVTGPVISWELGTDPTDAVPTGVDRATSLAASRYGFDTGYALTDDGPVLAWGSNRVGALGNATSDDDPHPDPAPIQGLNGVGAVADVFGDEDPAAVDIDGRVWLWGSNHDRDGGARGPTLLSGIDSVTKVVGAFALRQDGTVWSWAHTAAPTPVPDLAGVTDIATIGQAAVVVVQADGTVRTADQLHPDELRPTGMDNATALVGAGGRWAFATTTDGTVWAVPSLTGIDVQVVGLTDVAKIVWTLDEGYLALRTDGSLWAFSDPSGSVGPGPVVAPLPPVADVAVAGDRVYAIINP